MPKQVTARTRPVLHWTYKGTDYSYPVTAADHLWWTRSIWREGAPQIAVGHALLQRFAFLYSTGGPYRTLTGFLRAYCQPINPAWLPGGRLSEAKIKRLIQSGDSAGVTAERARAALRAQYTITPLAQIPNKYRTIADAILAGATESPVPAAMHFTQSFAASGDDEETAKQKAEAYATKRNLKVVPISDGFRSGLNWFFAIPGKNPPIVSVFRVAIASILPLGLLGLAVTLFVLWRKRRN